ncbi:zinc finger FYVE domain-containing protein 9 isoform X2 [Daktulosphaira vitifoliae]|uniref:zinc finger FYVE domain-containing protein 9 isoform X2 n=1 Tax=Daktulosphaira vitifoliae TaxID=58002 RepID=UPI0021A9B4F9|nr:zinc finger FYVE domain-containing protein 9 isoform X2 [Daktulosphaira vitifoliae]
MEKFAVDLDKVLDEFEFNEEKEQLQATIPTGRTDILSTTQATIPVLSKHLPAANYRRPSFEPINLADANFGVDSPSSMSDKPSTLITDVNKLSDISVPEQCSSFLNIDSNPNFEVISNESKAYEPMILDTIILLDDNTVNHSLKEFRSDLLESCDLGNENDKNNLTNGIQRIPTVESCPALITSPDSLKDDCTLSSELHSMNTSDNCEIDSTNAECSDVELYKCLEEYEDQDDASSINNTFGNYTDVNSLSSEFTDKLIAEKPLISDESVSESKDSVSPDISNDMVLTNYEIENEIEQPLFPYNEVEEPLKMQCYLATTTTSITDYNLCTESVVEEISTESTEKENHFIEVLKIIPQLPIVPEKNIKSECNALVEIADQEIIENSIEIDNNLDTVNTNDDNEFLNESQNKQSDEMLDKELTDSLCSIESTETILLKDDNQVSVATVSDSLDSQSTCSLPSEMIGDNIETLNINDIQLQRPCTLDLNRSITNDSEFSSTLSTDSDCALSLSERQLGKIQPYWIPDEAAKSCMRCDLKFTVVKRRHHCRACGEVLCSKCCNLRAYLTYMNNEVRVCQQCFNTLEKAQMKQQISTIKHPNPNNPMEYCSTVPPLQQVGDSRNQPLPSVLVPVSVLKREGRAKSDVPKQVMFSDGIRPGGDLADLDGSSERILPIRRSSRSLKKLSPTINNVVIPANKRPLNSQTQSYIPNIGLPPAAIRTQGELKFDDTERPIALNDPETMFAINPNLFLYVRRVFLDCCVKRETWCISTEGLSCVGQDEIVILLETLPNEKHPPRDIFLFINNVYKNASIGVTVSDMSFTTPINSTLLDSNNHGGFLFIRQTYQCMQKLRLPSPPYLFALLVHQYETPWAKMFPIRLMLRLGAEYRYYPCMLVSIRNRPSLYTEIGQTVIKLLVDFRQYSYGLPTVKGCYIHMDEKQIMVLLPRNRYDQVTRLVLSSNRGLLAFGANFSAVADSHLVCVQSTKDDGNYNTQAINIHNKPRQITGASFIALNGDLKDDAGTRWRIVEDGVMVEMSTQRMNLLREALHSMKDFKVNCGTNDEQTVIFHWTEDDVNFNIGVRSCIDGKPLDGIYSIRVHNGVDYSGKSRFIRWTEVFVIQCEETSDRVEEPLDTSRTAESIAKATCTALVPLLDLLSAASLTPLALRIMISLDSVGYEAGSGQNKLPPLYMQSLDEHLVPVVNAIAIKAQQSSVVLELVFRVMEH